MQIVTRRHQVTINVENGNKVLILDEGEILPDKNEVVDCTPETIVEVISDTAKQLAETNEKSKEIALRLGSINKPFPLHLKYLAQ